MDINRDYLTLEDKISKYLTPKEVKGIKKAFEFAADRHQGQLRQSGEPYIIHPLSAAHTLADLYLDSDTLQATLLHDVIEDCGVTFQEIETHFSQAVAKLVDGVTKLTQLDLPESATQFSDA